MKQSVDVQIVLQRDARNVPMRNELISVCEEKTSLKDHHLTKLSQHRLRGFFQPNPDVREALVPSMKLPFCWFIVRKLSALMDQAIASLHISLGARVRFSKAQC